MKLLTLLCLCLFVGCGGGGSMPSAAPAPPASPAPATPPPTVPAPPPVIPALPTAWKITDLLPLVGSNAAQANAVNSAGDAVGYSMIGGVPHATLWPADGSAPVDLGLGIASAINDSGEIVGNHTNSAGMQQAFIWPNQEIPLASGFDSSAATGVNKAGEVVGLAYTLANPSNQTGFTWQKGALSVLSGCAAALAVNDAGQIAGISGALNPAVCGMSDLVPQAGAATAINSAGQVVGYTSGPPAEAWVWPTQLEPSLATGINDFGWVIGYQVSSTTSARVKSAVQLAVQLSQLHRFNPELLGVSQPWLWSSATGVVDLPGAATVNGINKKGQIVGAAFVGSEIHGILLTGD